MSAIVVQTSKIIVEVSGFLSGIFVPLKLNVSSTTWDILKKMQTTYLRIEKYVWEVILNTDIQSCYNTNYYTYSKIIAGRSPWIRNLYSFLHSKIIIWRYLDVSLFLPKLALLPLLEMFWKNAYPSKDRNIWYRSVLVVILRGHVAYSYSSN